MDTLVVGNIQLEPTIELYKSQLFAAIDNNRAQLSEFLPRVDSIRTVADLKEYLKNAMRMLKP